MKLWYQSALRRTRWGARSQVMREIVDRIRSPDTEIEFHGPEREGFTEARPEPGDIQEIVSNVRLAADRGFHAFLIGNIADTGIEQTRAVAEIPVLGLCEASLKTAGMMGANFLLVTVNRSFTPLVVDAIARLGMEDRLVAVRDMGIERLSEVDRGFDDPEARRRITGQFLAAAHADGGPGADVVIAAGSALMALLAYDGIEETADGTPIVDGIANLVKLGELAVKVNRVFGGKFTRDRLEIATDMLRSYDAAPTRRARPTDFVTIGTDGAPSGFLGRRPAG